MGVKKAAKQPKRRFSITRLFWRTVIAGATLAAILIVLLIGYITFWPFEVRPQELTTTVLGDDGNVLTTIFVENRTAVKLEDISGQFLQAVVAVEDARFYQHPGIDIIRLAKVILINIKERSFAQGASTITQQLARELYLTQDKNFVRKIREAIIALQLERHLSKQEILEMYVSQVYMGHGLYGIQNAAQFYFGKDADELNLAQASLLAGVIQIPEVYSPYNNWNAARRRQKIVLDRMVLVGAITRQQADQAYADEQSVRPIKHSGTQLSASYVKQAIVTHLGSRFLNGSQYAYRGGLTIETTINRELQLAAEQAVREGIDYLDSLNQGKFLLKNADGTPYAEVALVALDPRSGEIKAMVGGKSSREYARNRVYLSDHHPGSTFKPFLYAEALLTGKVTLGTPVLCGPVEFQIPGQENPWVPKDFGGKYHDAELTIREAITVSDNVIAAKVMNDVGPENVVELAQSLGFPLGPQNAVLALALGSAEVSPLDMAVGYATLSNGGYKVSPVMITKVEDQQSRVWESTGAAEPTRVLDERVAYLLTDALQDVLTTEGTGHPVLRWYSDSRAAAKTGTTENNEGKVNSAWLAGYTPDLVTVVYVGADIPQQAITNAANTGGGGIAGAIWGRFMNKAQKVLPNTPLRPVPEGIVKHEICKSTGQLATRACPPELRVEELYLQEYAPTETCSEHGTVPGQDDKDKPWWWFLFPNWPPGLLLLHTA